MTTALPSPPPPVAARTAGHLLLVEDNPGDALLARELLAEGWPDPMDLRHVASLTDGLRALADDPPACLLLDLDLPDASGLETVERCVSTGADVPIVVLTGRDDDRIGVEAVRMGAEDYLTKGRFDGPALARVVRHAMERRESRRRIEVSERRIRAMFEHVPVGQCLIGGDGHVLEANAALATMLRTTPAALVGAHVDELLENPGGPFHERIQRYKADVARTMSATRARRLRAADGAVIDVRLTTSAVVDAAGELVSVVALVEDLTAAHVAQEELRASEARFRALLGNLSDLVVVLDRSGRVRYATPSARWIAGVDDESELLGADPLQAIVRQDRLRALRAFRAWIGGLPVEAPVALRAVDGSGAVRHLELVGVNLLDDPAVEGVVVTAHDVTDRTAEEEARLHEALHDQLTGLPNRTLLLDRMEQALQRARRTKRGVAVLFVDLDRFKVVNDTFGHGAGDAVLTAVAELLAISVRPGDTVARFGGDEFVVLCEDVDAEDATAVAQRIVEALSRPFGVRGKQVHLGASVGVAVGSAAPSAAADLLRDADTALYEAKQSGRGRVTVFDHDLRARTVRRMQIEDELRGAIDRDELALHYQPIVALADGSITGVEALLRWQHPQLGMVSPGEFVPVAEETGLIRAIGDWVLRRTCEQARRWLDDHGGVVVNVNLSAVQLADPGFVESVQEALVCAGVPAHLLCLEITESTVMEDPLRSASTLKKLRALGTRIAIDDFGTGYSSLAYLKRFDVDELKVDRSFVAGLGSDAEDTIIVGSVIHLARSLGIAVVAEGVETEAQLDHLAGMGCDFGQGYLWARPQPADGVGALLGSRLRAAGPATTGVASPGRDGSGTSEAMAAVAHELRTPITVIRGFAETIGELVAADRTDVLEQVLDTISRQTLDMERVVSGLADMSAVEEGRLQLAPEVVDLVAECKLVVGDLQRLLQGHDVTVVGAPGCRVTVDRVRFRQVLRNLLANAAKAAPAGTEITVDVTCDAEWATVAVRDEGPGVPPTRVGELFRKFSRLGAAGSGTGLGLYLSRQLARAHGGDLTYRRRSDRGAEFTLHLPVPAGSDAPSGMQPGAVVGLAAPGAERKAGSAGEVAEVAGRDTQWVLNRALRALLRADHPEEVVGVAIALACELGGRLVPATGPVRPHTLPLDLSLGQGDGLFVAADPGTEARHRLEQALPVFLHDAEDVMAALRRRGRRPSTDIDRVTGLVARRRASTTMAGWSQPSALLLVGVHADRDRSDGWQALGTLARLLREAAGGDDLLVRWGSDRLLLARPGDDHDGLRATAENVLRRWPSFRPDGPRLAAVVTSAGDGRAVPQALSHAAEAVRRSLRAGGGIAVLPGR